MGREHIVGVTKVTTGDASGAKHPTQSASATPEQGAAPLVGTGEMVLLPRALAEEVHGDLCELRAEWQWKKDEPRAENAREYAALVTRLDKLGTILHEQENDADEPRLRSKKD